MLHSPPMQRVWILLAAFAATLSYAKPPNIVYIISDDQTWTDYSFMGHKIIETPQIDKLRDPAVELIQDTYSQLEQLASSIVNKIF